MVFAWVFILFSGWWVANCVLDSSAAKDQPSEMIEIVDAEINFAEIIPVSWGELKSWERPGDTLRLSLTWEEESSLWPGLAVLVKVHEGAFGVPWVSGIIRDEERYAVTVLRVSPTASMPWRSLITSHLEHRRWNEAAQAADAYFSHYPKSYAFATYVGGALVAAGRFKLGIPYLERVVAARPDYTSFQLLGQALTKSGQLDRGIEVLRTSISLKPDDYEAYYHLGFSYLKAENPEEARLMFEKALERRPNFPEVEAQLAKLRRQEPRIGTDGKSAATVSAAAVL
jgi:tetratricopeptide (TPR) repeat protein